MNALEDFSRSAARRYLQSAVFVDDHIFDQESGMPTIPPDVSFERKPIYRPAEESGEPSSRRHEMSEEELAKRYHPKDLVSSFAREGITCALYEPPEGFSTDANSEIFKLCERPDIIILDWDFSGDQGAKALDLIAALVRQSTQEFPHHTRLIAVYTADPSLVAVANKIADRLGAEALEATPEEFQCRLRSGATRLVVMGKPIGRFGEEEEKFTVKESDLAGRLIEEFAGMNAGILPSYALHGLAAIRRNSKRILDRFHGDLDGAFLLQRALIAFSEEAFDQLPELLAEEMRAVVEDQTLTEAQAKAIADAALDGAGLSATDKDLLRQFTGKNTDKIMQKLREGGAVKHGHERLAALFSTRTQYSSGPKHLTFGTVVRYRSNEGDSWQFALCLVPACDSLRLSLDKPARFPFWSLKEDIYTGKGRRRGIVLVSDDGKHASLSASGSAADMFWTETFNVEASSKTVVAVQNQGVFTYAGSAKRIDWAGQLKPLHAQRIAHDITEALSRVGPNEAEWLRLLCK